MTLCRRRSRVALLMTAYDSDSKAVGHDRTGGFASLPQEIIVGVSKEWKIMKGPRSDQSEAYARAQSPWYGSWVARPQP